MTKQNGRERERETDKQQTRERKYILNHTNVDRMTKESQAEF